MDTTIDKEIIQDILSGNIDIIDWLSTQDEDTIRERLYERIPEDLDSSVGSYLYDSLEPTTIEFAIAYFMLRNIILLAYPQHSFGEWLTLSAATKGVYRKNAQYATGTLNIVGNSGTIIPKGTKFSNAIPKGSTNKVKYYSAVSDYAIPTEGIITISIQADEAGTVGNAVANEVVLNIEGIKSIASVTNTEAISNGINEESDESLLDRLLESVRNKATSGNKASYKVWAKEVAGVADAEVLPLWNGPGTVKVIVMGEGGRAIPELTDEVKEYLDPIAHEGNGEGKAPIGAVVTVASVENYEVDIRISYIELENEYNAELVFTGVKKSILHYLSSLLLGEVIRIRSIEDAIHHTKGVLDFGKVFINNDTNNIKPDSHLKPVIGGINVDEYI